MLDRLIFTDIAFVMLIFKPLPEIIIKPPIVGRLIISGDDFWTLWQSIKYKPFY